MARVFVDIRQFYNTIWHEDVNIIIWSIFLQVAVLKHHHNIVQIGVFPVFLVAVASKSEVRINLLSFSSKVPWITWITIAMVPSNFSLFWNAHFFFLLRFVYSAVITYSQRKIMCEGRFSSLNLHLTNIIEYTCKMGLSIAISIWYNFDILCSVWVKCPVFFQSVL